MATYGRALRRGLPRIAGGEAWPPAGETDAIIESAAAPVAAVAVPSGAPQDAGVTVVEAPAAVAASTESAPAAPAPAAASAPGAPVASAPTTAHALRRGLPRVAGGEPWPPAGSAAVAAAVAPAVADSVTVTTSAATTPVAADSSATASPASASVPTPASTTFVASGADARRGLPRVAGGDPWPPAGTRLLSAVPVAAEAADSAEAVVASATTAVTAVTASSTTDVSTPLPVPTSVTPGRYAFEHPVPVEPRRIGKFTIAQWTGLAAVSGFALIAFAFLLVTATRWILSLEGPASFITTYPGEYDLPDGAVPGFPAWAQWQHFFNIFLMVLIIRSGWGVRTEQRPSAFFTNRWSKDSKKKISLTLWFHQALDVLWLTNGIVFVVLLFASGHWMRVVPTSWEVFPNALSAVLQYISLDWPTEHGWVNYNSIQQLMYFTVIFLAAPLAAATGVRMSGFWPKNAATLNKIYPVEVARAIHFPVMLFFVLFILVHVFLVFATGALRNLNHMFGGTDAMNWNGFWIFVLAMATVAGAVAASRTIVLAPIAKLFGSVSSR